MTMTQDKEGHTHHVDEAPPLNNQLHEDMLLGHAGVFPPLVPDGEYSVIFSRAERGRFEVRERTFLWFRIATPGENLGKQIYLVCAHPSNGGRVFGLGSKLVAAATVALGSCPKRRSRITTRIFRDKVFLARTRTVSKDRNRKARAPVDWYSVIDKLLSVEVGL